MKIIRIKTDNTIQVLQYPKEINLSIENEKLRGFIGDSCEVIEHVRPRRLYDELGAGIEPTRFKGDCVGMLIDDNGIDNKLPVNMVASWLYGADVHGCPIVGDVLIVGEYWEGDGVSFCGLSEYNFGILFGQLQLLTELARRQGCLNMSNV